MAKAFPDEIELDLELDDPQDLQSLRQLAASKLGVKAKELPPLVVLKRAIDARRGRVRFHLVLGPASVHSAVANPAEHLPALREVDSRNRVAIVGAGPAGMFCAYELARHGISSTVYDRGKPVQPRRRDLRALQQEGIVDPDSNYCFGEGGAGTYSDGKLYTRSHKRGNVRDVMEVLVAHGAPEAILTDARPHIGSNQLPKVITNLREQLEAVGVRFRFESRVEGLLSDQQQRVCGLALADGSEHEAEAVVLAIGHSARNLYQRLAEDGLALEPKGFAVGVRIEHPQALINEIQYGRSAGHPALPSAAYRLAHTKQERGVFSFCMCPGGFIVPAATEPGTVVVNGMSLSKRDSPFANSGLVVAVEPEDLVAAGFKGALAGIEYQRALEERAWACGGNADQTDTSPSASPTGQRAPATRVSDFVARRASSSTPNSSYQPGLFATDIAEVLDGAGLAVSERLREALEIFGRKMRGFVSEEAVLVGVESRTSSPVRIPRDGETLQHNGLAGLYPCGEGAGYAGGIVSAAVDGIRIAEAITRTLPGL